MPLWNIKELVSAWSAVVRAWGWGWGWGEAARATGSPPRESPETFLEVRMPPREVINQDPFCSELEIETHWAPRGSWDQLAPGWWL